MKNITIIICMFLLMIQTIYADDVLGKVTTVVGKISIIRGEIRIRPKMGTKLELRDSVEVYPRARFIVTLIDGSELPFPEGETVRMEDLVMAALTERASHALDTFLDLVKNSSHIKNYDSIKMAAMGSRDTVDETSTYNTIAEIDKILRGEKNLTIILDLLCIKADLFLQLGNFAEVTKIYKEVLSRDKKKTKTDKIKGLLEILDVLNNRHLRVSLFSSENFDIASEMYDILRDSLSSSGRMTISGTTDESDPETIVDNLLTGSITLKDTTMSIDANIINPLTREIKKSWTISGDKKNIGFLSRQLASSVYFFLTQKNIPGQSVFHGLYESKGIDMPEEVDLYLGLNNDGIFPTYRIDEELILHARVRGEKNKKYYITILRIRPDGEVHLLYPNYGDTAGTMEMNTHYILPKNKNLYNFTVTGITGENYIIGIVTEKPFSLADTTKIKNKVFPKLSSFPEDYINNQLKVSAKDSDINWWKIRVIHFMTNY
ncbi:MAG: DUF4384 domain-containing protein [Spirochaetales bacterium]|nr:DUF4384 domain-containing protein [Spirochaetales bacterium]